MRHRMSSYRQGGHTFSLSVDFVIVSVWSKLNPERLGYTRKYGSEYVASVTTWCDDSILELAGPALTAWVYAVD